MEKKKNLDSYANRTQATKSQVRFILLSPQAPHPRVSANTFIVHGCFFNEFEEQEVGLFGKDSVNTVAATYSLSGALDQKHPQRGREENGPCGPVRIHATFKNVKQGS